MKIDETTALVIRSVFCSHINLHPAWNQENRTILEEHFDLDEEQIDALHVLESWIVSHQLEYALGYGDGAPGQSTQDLVQKAYDLLQRIDQNTDPQVAATIRHNAGVALLLAGACPKKG